MIFLGRGNGNGAITSKTQVAGAATGLPLDFANGSWRGDGNAHPVGFMRVDGGPAPIGALSNLTDKGLSGSDTSVGSNTQSIWFDNLWAGRINTEWIRELERSYMLFQMYEINARSPLYQDIIETISE